MIATVAQLVEQFIRNERVRGSSPFSGSNIKKKMEKQFTEQNSPSQVIPQFQVEGVQILRKITTEYSEIFTQDALRFVILLMRKFNGRRKEKGLAVEKMIREKGGEATFFQSDVSIETQVQNFVAAAVKKYGKIDIAYNNAGIVLGRIPIHQQTLEQWNKIHSINSTGVFLCMKYELQQMLKQKAGGSIINVSSTVGHSGFSKLPDYTSTKHSVCGLTRAAAVMYAKDNIRINAISPSDVRTPLIGGDKYVDQISAEHPMGRVAEPEEIVKTVMFLASDDASYVNGETMLVTGAALTI